MSKLTVRVSARTDKKTGEKYFEGSVEVAGLQPTKLVKNDGCSRYTSQSQVSQAANRLGQKFLLPVEIEQPAAAAAKKSVKKTAKKSNATGCCPGGVCRSN